MNLNLQGESRARELSTSRREPSPASAADQCSRGAKRATLDQIVEERGSTAEVRQARGRGRVAIAVPEAVLVPPDAR